MMRLEQIILARRVADVRFDDLTAAKLTGEPRWVPGEPDVLEVPLDRDVTTAEKARIRRRLATPDKVTEDRVTAWADARTALRQVKGLAPPFGVIVAAVIALLDDKLAAYGE